MLPATRFERIKPHSTKERAQYARRVTSVRGALEIRGPTVLVTSVHSQGEGYRLTLRATIATVDFVPVSLLLASERITSRATSHA